MHRFITFLLLAAVHCAAAVPDIDQILKQDGAAFPKTWGTRSNAPVLADYEMDPDITNDPAYRERLPAALNSLPSLLITTSNDDLFSSGRGIYSNPMESGDDWERPTRAELIATNGTSIFNVQCGLRIHGGWNRRPEESPKHAFRLVFKKKYGPGKLNAAIFGPDAATEFDSLVLRAGCNNTWLHWHPTERARGDFLRDQWMRDTQRALGHPASRGIFVHLYLNGLYWGLYNLVERPDESFASAYLGGARKDFDSRNADKILSGDSTAWDNLMQRINTGVRTEADFKAISELIEMDSFIDYMLLNLYGANADWDRSSNWFAARPRKPGGKWHFFVWDAERTLENVDDNRLTTDDDQSPTRIFQRLRENETFRNHFAERARKHLTEGGALSPKSAAERYRVLAQQIELAVIAESARWGDYRRDLHPYREGPYQLHTPNLWQTEINCLLTDYFPIRTKTFIDHLKFTDLLH
ncbi:MAG TPA: CotH kinase family protein [Verrucomicrobiae bacterium]